MAGVTGPCVENALLTNRERVRLIVSMRHREIAEQVRAWLEYRELSQRGLAAAAGISNALVTKIESGAIGDPRLGTCRKLAAALGVTLVELVDGNPTKRARGKR